MVLAPSTPADAKGLFKAAIRDDDPVVFFESRSSYNTVGSVPQGEHIVVLENGTAVNNVVVCKLCSCYPWPVLGLPPSWYKDPAYRSRIVSEPRTVLAELGLDLDETTEIKVWDSSSEVRYFVLPERPEGTEDLDEEALAALVTRDAMVGVGKVPAP